MTQEHTPLDPAKLSPAAQKALASAPGRMMAARGLVPLPPADQVAVLYQLAIDADANLATSARTSITGMPETLLGGALGDGKVDPRVLDLFAQLVGDRPAAFDALVGNAAITDATIAKLAERGGAREIERIAANEQRLLRHPEIIAAMYLNKRARMSTVDRAIELAVRNKIRVPGLAAWDEIEQALHGAPKATKEVDELFAKVADKVTGDDSVLTTGDVDKVPDEDPAADAKPDEDIPFRDLSVPAKIRTATLGNAWARAEAIRDPLRIVAMAAIKSPGTTEVEAARHASNAGLSDAVIRYIAEKREWTRFYGVKIALCRNPKTPIAEAMRMMPFLREKDLTVMTRSKGVASAVVAQARKLLMQRRGQDKKK